MRLMQFCCDKSEAKDVVLQAVFLADQWSDHSISTDVQWTGMASATLLTPHRRAPNSKSVSSESL